MNNEIFTYDTGKNLAQKNMDLDEILLKNLKNQPILHFYDWLLPSITYGYFVEPSKYLYIEYLKKEGIDLARRPTGGGIVFHLWDLAFSFLLPATHPRFSLNPLINYHFVNQIVLTALEEFLRIFNISLTKQDFSADSPNLKYFCMARPTKYDVVLAGKKIAGAAQRKKKQGYLHQGTISLAFPDFSLLKRVLKDSKVVDAMKQYTHAPLELKASLSLDKARVNLKKILKQIFFEKTQI